MAVSTIDPNGLNIGQIGGTRNKIINGAMTIDQRNAGAAVTAKCEDQFPVDRFLCSTSQTARFLRSKTPLRPTKASSIRFKYTTTTADGTLTSYANYWRSCSKLKATT
jgi:hypothetical protein